MESRREAPTTKAFWSDTPDTTARIDGAPCQQVSLPIHDICRRERVFAATSPFPSPLSAVNNRGGVLLVRNVRPIVAVVIVY